VIRFLTLFLLGSAGVFAASAGPTPLLRAHAHNDYLHARPLFDALDLGFCNIEADVHLVDGRLLVAHDRKDVKPERTLEALYLEPLRQRVRQNGGRVFRDGPVVTLLVDVKSEADATYAALHAVLKAYADIVTTVRDNNQDESRAIAVIVSGNRARAEMTAQRVRYAGLDGRSEDLDSTVPASLMPWISDNWTKLSAWRGEGALPESDQTKLRDWVARAHAHGRKLRLWNTPEGAVAWKVLDDAGVDVIGSDDLTALRDFFGAPPRGRATMPAVDSAPRTSPGGASESGERVRSSGSR
jgi:hypothetical protein